MELEPLLLFCLTALQASFTSLLLCVSGPLLERHGDSGWAGARRDLGGLKTMGWEGSRLGLESWARYVHMCAGVSSSA